MVNIPSGYVMLRIFPVVYMEYHRGALSYYHA